MAIGDLVTVKWRYLVGGQSVINTFGFKDLDGLHTFTQLAADLWTAANGLPLMIGSSRNNCVTQDLTVVDVKPGTAATLVYTAASPPTGGDTLAAGGELLPPQSAFVGTWRTALAGRSYRGRVYLSGMGVLRQVAGVWTTAHQTGLSSVFTSFFARYRVTGGVYAHWGLVVVSRQNAGIVRPTPVGTEITSFTVRPNVYSQRRREVGIGI